MQTKLPRWWAGPDNQEVGLEAATLQRVRNSSLVESGRADNVPGIKSGTDAMGWGPPPPERCRPQPIASVADLIPGELSARIDSTSELLRTL